MTMGAVKMTMVLLFGVPARLPEAQQAFADAVVEVDGY